MAHFSYKYEHLYANVLLLPPYILQRKSQTVKMKGGGLNEQNNNLKVNFAFKFLLTHYPFFWRSVGSHRALNERSYIIHLCPLLGVSLLYPLALPSLLSSGSVIDRPQQLRPPTALSSFGDTLSVLIRVLIGRLAVGEWHQGLGHRGDTDFPEIPFVLSPPSLSLFLSFLHTFFFLPVPSLLPPRSSSY